MWKFLFCHVLRVQELQLQGDKLHFPAVFFACLVSFNTERPKILEYFIYFGVISCQKCWYSAFGNEILQDYKDKINLLTIFDDLKSFWSVAGFPPPSLSALPHLETQLDTTGDNLIWRALKRKRLNVFLYMSCSSYRKRWLTERRLHVSALRWAESRDAFMDTAPNSG